MKKNYNFRLERREDMNWKISIVTICKNAENEIIDTLQSVLLQDYSNLEYIIIDGGSTDETNNIINQYYGLLHSKGIKTVHISEPDKGISDAFNKGISISTGDIIGLINAGDTLLEDSLRTISENFDEQLDVLYGNTVFVDKKNGIKYLRKKPENVDYSKFASRGLVFTHQSAFVKKKMYDTVGLYDLDFKIIMDTELFIRFYQSGATFKYIDKNLVSMLAGGISSKPSKKLYEEHIEIGRRYGGVSRWRLRIHYICDMPIAWLKTQVKKNKKLWNFLIGKKRSLKK